MDTIRVKIVPNRELFRDDDTGFKIYSADVREADGEVEYNNYGNISVKGDNLPDFNIGSLYDIDIAKNPRDKYKGSYSMVKSHYVKPQTAEEQWKFLSMIVTENQYVSISRAYSAEEDKIIDIITNDEFDYERVDGYGEITYNSLKEKVKLNMDVSEALAYFSEYEVSYNLVKRLVSKYGSAEVAIKEVEKNPYSIVEKDGFGFIMADELAMKLGIPKDSPHRIRTCMEYVLDEISSNGDIWLNRKKLYNKMKKLLKIKRPEIEAVMDEENENVFCYDDRYATMRNARNEMRLAFMLSKKILKEEPLLSNHDYDPDGFIERFEDKNKVTLSDQQREFLYDINKTNLMFLIGNAGSGKSFLQKVVIDIAEELGLSYALLAPTGKASRVLKNYTGREAYTIHKKIGFGGFEEVESIPEDIILVDEASMADINIATKLMSVVRDGRLVIFIGDDAQIPSVGEGNFLYDCINFDKTPMVKLNKIFRQKESGMLDAITRTRKGRAFLNTTTVNNQRLGNNFEFRHMMKEQIVDNLLESYEKMLSSGHTVEEIGVLTPTNIGDVGTIEINRQIQERVNPQGGTYLKEEHTFGNKGNERTLRVGDYVMNTENMYDATVTNKAETINVFNGECGTIIAVNENSKEIIVDFEGNHVLFSFSEAMKKLSHAWAISIHKSQGSQYKIVLIVVDSSATYQLNLNLLYTAMSRAQDYLGVFGQARTYNRALHKLASFSRNSFLNEFLDISYKIIEDSEGEIETDVLAENTLELLRSEGNFS